MFHDFPRPHHHPGIDYRLLEPLTPTRARFTFTGPFLGTEIVWNTTLIVDARQSFIDIGNETPQGRLLTVALPVPVVDEAVILRTIIMIRQYKRLYPGRHDFGTPAAT